MMNRHMKRKLRALGLVAAMMVFSAQMATAAITSDSVIASYQAEGYTRIEVRIGPTQMKVEAIKGNVKVETIYDIATGTVLKTETEAVQAGENIAPGVSVRKRDQDFVDAGNSSDDDSNDDSDDDSNDDSDDDSNDDSDDDSNDDSDDDSNDDSDDDSDDDSSDDSDDDSNDDNDDDSSDDSDDDSDDDSSGHGGDDDRD